MDIGNALRRAGRDDITIQAVIANTVKKVYKETSSHDVSIASVQLKWKKVFVKTWNALINSELQFLEWEIKKASIGKLSSMHIKIWSDIVFRFI